MFLGIFTSYKNYFAKLLGKKNHLLRLYSGTCFWCHHEISKIKIFCGIIKDFLQMTRKTFYTWRLQVSVLTKRREYDSSLSKQNSWYRSINSHLRSLRIGLTEIVNNHRLKQGTVYSNHSIIQIFLSMGLLAFAIISQKKSALIDLFLIKQVGLIIFPVEEYCYRQSRTLSSVFMLGPQIPPKSK